MTIETQLLPAGYISLYGNNFGSREISSSYSCAVYDSLGNLYLGASTYEGSLEYGVISKFDTYGALLWQKTFGAPPPYRIDIYGLSLDSSSNVYLTGRITSDGTLDSLDVLLIKYDTDGNLQWQKTLGTAGLSQIGNGIVADNDGNFYICGQYLTTTGFPQKHQMLISKFNSSGILQWQRSMSDPTTNSNIGYTIALDSTGNVYVTGTSSSPYNPVLVKYNSNGDLQWQVGLYKSGGYGDTSGICIDSSDNIYTTGWTLSGPGGTNAGILVKYNTSGAIQWKKQLDGTDARLGSVTTDSAGNVYVVGGMSVISIAKYNSSGVLQWQRKLTAPSITSTYTLQGLSVYFDNFSNKIIVVGSITLQGTTDYTEIIMAKLPLDGSPTGTYGVGNLTINYSASSYANGDLNTWTASSGGPLSNSATTFTVATTALASANATFSNTVTQIP